MRSRKGQAAMEFLMTYGWAILIAIIAIAALIAFGVFNPPVQEVCTGSGGLGAIINGVICSPDTIYAKVGEPINITVDNTLATPINLTISSVTVKRNAGSASCTSPDATDLENMPAGSVTIMQLTGCNPATAGKPYEATLTGTFTDGVNSYPFSFKFIKETSS
jgi:hypothetical protein